MHHLLDELRRRITHEAVNQHTTVFADDFLLQKIFVDRAGLLAAVGMFEQLLSVIRLFGLDCSYDKSAVLVVTQGYAGQREFRSLCVPHPEHKWCLRLKVDDTLCDIPVRAVHKYLGAQLSYRAQEKHTLEYRVQCARTAFSRLWRFVRCKHVPLDKRVQLWRVYVRTTLFYSLSSCGLDCAGPTRIVGLAAKHLRLISRLPAHITRIDNHALFKRLQVEHPLQTLTRMAEARHTRLLNAPPGLARDDKLATWRHDILQQLRAHSLSAGPPALDQAAVSSNPASVRLMPAPCTQVVTCHLCGQTFPNTPALRQHITRSHDASHTSTTAAHDAQDCDSFRAHAKDGMPCCRHCNKAFSGWPQFRVHILREACPVLHGFVPAIGHLGHTTPQVPSSASGSMPAASEPRAAEARLSPYFVVPEVVSAAKAGWLDVTATAYVQEKSVNHCLFCFQWCKKGYVQHHVQSQHKDSLLLVQRAFEVCRAERHRLTAKRPCPFCNQTVDAAVRHCIVCPVLTTSVCLHLLMQEHAGDGCGCRDADNVRGSVASSSSPSRDRDSTTGQKAPHPAAAHQGGNKEPAAYEHKSLQSKRRRPDSSAAAVASNTSSGGRTVPLAPGQGLLSLPGGERGGERLPDTGGSGQRVEAPETGRRHETAAATQNCAVQQPADGAPCQTSACRSAGNHTGKDSGSTVDGGSERRSLLVLPSLGPTAGQEPSAPHQSLRSPHRSANTPRRAEKAVTPRRPTSQVPQHTALGLRTAAPSHLPSASQPKGTRSKPGSRTTQSACRLRLLAPAERALANRKGPTQPAGKEARAVPGTALEPLGVVRLSLNNTSNHCYINSLVLSWLWCAAALRLDFHTAFGAASNLQCS